MKNIKMAFAAVLLATAATVAISQYSFATDKQFTIQLNNAVEGAELSDHSFTFELQDPTNHNTVLQTKTSSEPVVSFDPITLDDQDDTSHFYRIVMKNTGEAGMTYDKQDAYVRIQPKINLVAYQKDNTYHYDHDQWIYHPFHATDEELQGEAYAKYNTKTHVLTFFRAPEGEYTAEKCAVSGDCFVNSDIYDRHIADDAPEYTFYYTGFEKPANFEVLAWRLRSLATELVFEDAVRPEGEMRDWFKNYANLEKADISKLDTSRVTSFWFFFYECPKIDNIDISTLSFDSFDRENGMLRSFFRGTNVDEIDFRNFADPNVDDGLLNFGYRKLEDAFGLSKTRYLNTSNFDVDDSSAAFIWMNCLEKLVVGPRYSFYNSSIFYSNSNTVSSDFLKIETGEVDRLFNSVRGEDKYHPEAAGTYIRPICGTDPITFVSTYVKPTKKDQPANPATGDMLTALAAILAASGLCAAFVLRAKRR